MELKISEWRSEGLRCPDGVVNLKKNGFKRFNFVQMPNGIPVATVAVNAAKNAGLLAVRIIGSADKDVQNKMVAYQLDLEEKVQRMDDSVSHSFEG